MPSRAPAWRRILRDATIIWCVSSAVALAGLIAGHRLNSLSSPSALADVVFQNDARHFLDIATRGYEYDPHQWSTVAFFPAYPLSAALLSRLTRLPAAASLLIIASGCL